MVGRGLTIGYLPARTEIPSRSFCTDSLLEEGMLKQFEIPKVLIRVRKPNSPVKGIAGGLEVEIVRTALES